MKKNNQPMHHDHTTTAPPINIYNNTVHTFRKQGGLLLVWGIAHGGNNQQMCHDRTTTLPPINTHNKKSHTFWKQGGLLLVIFLTSGAEEPRKPGCTLRMKKNQPMHHDHAMTASPISIHNNTMHTFWKWGGLLLVIFILLATQNQKSPSSTLHMKETINQCATTVPWLHLPSTSTTTLHTPSESEVDGCC